MSTNQLTLVRAGILEEDDLALLESQTRLLCEEQVGALDDILEVRLALRVDERRDVGDVNGLGASTARDEEIGFEPEMSGVPEVGAVDDNLSSYTAIV